MYIHNNISDYFAIRHQGSHGSNDSTTSTTPGNMSPPTRAQIIEAAKLANIHEFISSLPLVKIEH